MKKGRKPSRFIGTIEAVKSIAEEEEEEFAQAIGTVSQKYELRLEFVKFAVTNFMKWKSDKHAYYLQKLRKATMEQLYAAENPESPGLVPESVTRWQEATLVKTNRTWYLRILTSATSRETERTLICLMTMKTCQRRRLLAVLLVLRKMTDYKTCPFVPAQD